MLFTLSVFATIKTLDEGGVGGSASFKVNPVFLFCFFSDLIYSLHMAYKLFQNMAP